MEDNSSIDNPDGQVIDSLSEISSDSGTAINMPDFFLPPFPTPSGFFPGYFPGFGHFGYAAVNGAGGQYASFPNMVASSAGSSVAYKSMVIESEDEDDDEDDQ